MLYLVPTAANRKVARANAMRLAEQLGASVKSRQGITVGLPHCPYAVRWNASEFWFGVKVSDDAYIVEGTHKDRFALPVAFVASFACENQAMNARIELPQLSRAFGVPVFVAHPEQQHVLGEFLSVAAAQAAFRELDLRSVRSLFLNGVQLVAVVEHVSTEHCFRQVRAMRALLAASIEWNSERGCHVPASA